MESDVFTYTNRRGVVYYVHETRTRRGVLRYLAKRSVQGALRELPAGLEVVESVNGQVSVRAARVRDILPLEESQVQQALETHERRHYRVEIKGRHIIIHEPLSDPDKMASVLSPFRSSMRDPDSAIARKLRETIGEAAWDRMIEAQQERIAGYVQEQMRFAPVLRFCLVEPKGRRFRVERMCYRGEGGWLGLAYGLTLAAACDRYVPLLGTEQMFEQF